MINKSGSKASAERDRRPHRVQPGQKDGRPDGSDKQSAFHRQPLLLVCGPRLLPQEAERSHVIDDGQPHNGHERDNAGDNRAVAVNKGRDNRAQRVPADQRQLRRQER